MNPIVINYIRQKIAAKALGKLPQKAMDGSLFNGLDQRNIYHKDGGTIHAEDSDIANEGDDNTEPTIDLEGLREHLDANNIPHNIPPTNIFDTFGDPLNKVLPSVPSQETPIPKVQGPGLPAFLDNKNQRTIPDESAADRNIGKLTRYQEMKGFEGGVDRNGIPLQDLKGSGIGATQMGKVSAADEAKKIANSLDKDDPKKMDYLLLGDKLNGMSVDEYHNWVKKHEDKMSELASNFIERANDEVGNDLISYNGKMVPKWYVLYNRGFLGGNKYLDKVNESQNTKFNQSLGPVKPQVNPLPEEMGTPDIAQDQSLAGEQIAQQPTQAQQTLQQEQQTPQSKLQDLLAMYKSLKAPTPEISAAQDKVRQMDLIGGLGQGMSQIAAGLAGGSHLGVQPTAMESFKGFGDNARAQLAAAQNNPKEILELAKAAGLNKSQTSKMQKVEYRDPTTGFTMLGWSDPSNPNAAIVPMKSDLGQALELGGMQGTEAAKDVSQQRQANKADTEFGNTIKSVNASIASSRSQLGATERIMNQLNRTKTLLYKTDPNGEPTLDKNGKEVKENPIVARKKVMEYWNSLPQLQVQEIVGSIDNIINNSSTEAARLHMEPKTAIAKAQEAQAFITGNIQPAKLGTYVENFADLLEREERYNGQRLADYIHQGILQHIPAIEKNPKLQDAVRDSLSTMGMTYEPKTHKTKYTGRRVQGIQPTQVPTVGSFASASELPHGSTVKNSRTGEIGTIVNGEFVPNGR